MNLTFVKAVKTAPARETTSRDLHGAGGGGMHKLGRESIRGGGGGEARY